MKESTYYKDQLNRLEDHDSYNKGVMIMDHNGNRTNNLDLNLESIDELQRFLKKEKARLKKIQTKVIKASADKLI